MKILALSDRVVEGVYSSNIIQNYGDVDLVLGCGDLPMYYLEFVADALNKPVLYVQGNHDTEPEMSSDGRLKLAPEGCEALDDHCMIVEGVLFMGLGGSVRYRTGAEQQFSEAGMMLRILRRLPGLLTKRLRHGKMDLVVVAHSPPRGVGDLDERVHRGFKAFLHLMSWVKPRYLLHGHVGAWQTEGGRTRRYLDTTVINVNPVYVLEIPTER